MADTPFIRASEFDLLGVVMAGPDIQASQIDLLAVYNFPTANIQASQFEILAIYKGHDEIQASQVDVILVGRGRPENPVVRAWTCTLDGHDFYVLSLGDRETLVYDVYSDTWTTWSSSSLNRFRILHGINWQGATQFANAYGSDILCGDDTFGLLWFLDPTEAFDESALYGDVVPSYFLRRISGQVTVRGRKAVPCYEANLTGSVGTPVLDGMGVTLFTSDDGGHSYDDQGTVNIVVGEYTQDLPWQSLGQIRSPGRLFRFDDYGALTRIDGLDVSIGPES